MMADVGAGEDAADEAAEDAEIEAGPRISPCVHELRVAHASQHLRRDLCTKSLTFRCAPGASTA